MSLLAFGIVLFAAVLHAGWNALVKGGGDTTLTTTFVALMAAVIAAVLLPFLPPPAPASWPYLGVAAVLQVAYYLLVAAAYREADMSQVYPLMRGLPPLLVAGVAALFLGEQPTLVAWAGIGLICGGVLSLAVHGRGANGQGVAFALANAVVIASYTLVDGAGARLSGSAASYTLWLAVLTAPPVVLWVALRRGLELVAFARKKWVLGAAGGAATTASYGLALWAMTEAPIAMVAALRETSIVFGTIIAALVLRERITPPRLLATAIIVLGAVVLRLA
jgi:drug/metabolite transporter (DMT)-like permease